MHRKGITIEQGLERLGNRIKNFQGSWMEIIAYRKASDIDVKFDSGYIASHVMYRNFILGNIRDRLFPSVLNVGIIGVGKYSQATHKKIYAVWEHILNRCYGQKDREKQRPYVNCEMCDEWKNFQNFAFWYENNYFEIPGEKMCVAKDLLKRGNKIYSPETCCILPNCINVAMVTKHNNKRQNECLSDGVYLYYLKGDKNKKYYAANNYSIDGKKKTKLFHTESEAYDYFVNGKERRIKEFAELYKRYLPHNTYNALYKYSARN